MSETEIKVALLAVGDVFSRPDLEDVVFWESVWADDPRMLVLDRGRLHVDRDGYSGKIGFQVSEEAHGGTLTRNFVLDTKYDDGPLGEVKWVVSDVGWDSKAGEYPGVWKVAAILLDSLDPDRLGSVSLSFFQQDPGHNRPDIAPASWALDRIVLCDEKFERRLVRVR